MKKEKLFEAIGEIKEAYIDEAHMTAKKSASRWLGWSTMAACLMLVVLVSVVAIPGMLNNVNTPSTAAPERIEELGLGESYIYSIDEGRFSAYASGKVIPEDKIGEKIEDVILTAGWRNNADMTWITQETLRGEVYLIDGISSDVAVALKFIDKGDAVTLTHYYVLTNPDADLTSVAEYVIHPLSPNNDGEE